MSANSILYFTWSISRSVYRQLMPKPDRKEGREGQGREGKGREGKGREGKGRKEGRKEERRKGKDRKEGFLICYITLTSGLKLLAEMKY